MNKIRKDIIKEANDWFGTPWQHQACVKGAGVDCAMLVAGTARNVGILSKAEMKTIPSYPKDWHFHQDFALLPHIMEKMKCVEKNIEDKVPGDILVFKIGRVPSHLGILLEDNIFIHAYSGGNCTVVRNSLSAQWVDRLQQVYRFPGIE